MLYIVRYFNGNHENAVFKNKIYSSKRNDNRDIMYKSIMKLTAVDDFTQIVN